MSSTSSTPAVGGQVEDLLDDQLADVGRSHRRQRQGDVVEGDGELHARPEQRRQRVAVAERVAEGVRGWRPSGSSSGSSGSGA